MNEEKKGLSPEEWEVEVKARLNEYIDNMLAIAKDCNMATKYLYAVKDEFETHVEFDETKISGAELRIVFNFVADLDKEGMTFV